MKSICVTGNSGYVIDIVSTALEKLGAPQAVPSKNNSDMTMQSWVGHVYGSPHKQQDVRKIGKLWEKVLVDIFLTNHKKPLWQWNEKISLIAYEYLHEFDTNIHFLVIFTSLAEHIDLALSKAFPGEDFNLKAQIDDWIFYTKCLKAIQIQDRTRTYHIHSLAPDTAEEAFRLVDESTTKEQCARVFDFSLSWKDPTFIYLATHLEKALLSAEDIKTSEDEWAIQILELTAALDYYISSRSDRPSVSNDSNSHDLRLQSRETFNGDLSEKIEELESENDLILFQLHETQEEFEHYIQKSKLTLKQAAISELRLLKALDKHPEYWEYESLTAEMIPGKNAISWHIKGTYLKTYYCEHLTLQTSGAGEKFTISIFNSQHASPAFFELSPFIKQIDFHLNNAKKDVPNPFSLLGPTDWDNLVFLIDRLIGWMSSGDAAEALTKDVINKTSLELCKVRKTLDKWPLTLRYDHIALKEIVDVENYSALGITLNNIRLGSEAWQTLDFRLSTFGDGLGDVGAHPRLEFPESSRQAIQSWYPESTDDRGPRLELRFSKPDAMDTTVWAKLADADKLLIAALLTNLNIQIHKLETASQEKRVPWREWHQMANFMRNTLAKIHQSAK